MAESDVRASEAAGGSIAAAGTGTVVVGARRVVAAPATEVYALLSDLRRHWPLLGGDLVEGGLSDGDGRAAQLLLRGPLPWIRRRVDTHVTHAQPDTAFGGTATAGSTHARIDWRLSAGHVDGTEVSFSVGIVPGGHRDRLMLLLARPWLVRRCARVLGRLEDALAGGTT